LSLHQLRTRLAALVAKLPRTGRVPRLAIIVAGDPDAEKKRGAAEAAGDPILNVTLFEPTDANEFAALKPNPT